MKVRTEVDRTRLVPTGPGPPLPPRSVPSILAQGDHPVSTPPPPPPPEHAPAPVRLPPSGRPADGTALSGHGSSIRPPPAGPVYPGIGYPYSPPRPGPPAPVLVRQTLQRRTWVWVVVITAAVAALLGGLVGAIVGANTQQTVIQKYFPNKSVLAKPQDIQEVLAKVEPAVVSIDSESGEGSGARSAVTSPSQREAG